MSDRKQTPNILADLLGGEKAGVEIPSTVGEALRPAPKTRRRAEPKSAGDAPISRRAAPAKEAAPAALLSKRWEHRLASFQEHNGWRLRYEDGKETPNWAAGPKLHEYISRMEAEGWQVAGACSGEAMFGVLDKYQIFFKRQQ